MTYIYEDEAVRTGYLILQHILIKCQSYHNSEIFTQVCYYIELVPTEVSIIINVQCSNSRAILSKEIRGAPFTNTD